MFSEDKSAAFSRYILHYIDVDIVPIDESSTGKKVHISKEAIMVPQLGVIISH